MRLRNNRIVLRAYKSHFRDLWSFYRFILNPHYIQDEALEKFHIVVIGHTVTLFFETTPIEQQEWTGAIIHTS